MKCTKCQGEWTPPANKSLSKCPFCQADILQMLNEQAEVLSTEVILANMLQAYGTDLLHNQQRLSAMISDLFAHDHKTKRLLLLSVSENIPIQLATLTDDTDLDNHILAVQHRLAEDAFLKEEAAKQIVSIWTCSLGWENEKVENTVTDIDGNMYKTVQIGNQIWMAENLRVSKYRNGDLIQNATDDKAWENSEIGAWCNYDNEPNNNSKYGKLYNWFAVDDKRGVAPKGWHVPSDEEWDVLIEFLGGNDVAGGKLKQSGSKHWLIPNEVDKKDINFNALPGGYRNSVNAFCLKRIYGYWWSSTQGNNSYSWLRGLNHKTYNVYRYGDIKSNGFSVRCIKDLKK